MDPKNIPIFAPEIKQKLDLEDDDDANAMEARSKTAVGHYGRFFGLILPWVF